ncbi:hypothetical protein GUJ93_ZPchr0006g43290 [Zizania palustris]|uniref:Secreted protein n=1 Tax=Zizania palustris TaxID=103762 RepID=A0A8J5T6V2_ZIZPA|nr:hypothetical protein GUJ93_ZPchr0006g43290 [Zizania palustris]
MRRPTWLSSVTLPLSAQLALYHGSTVTPVGLGAGTPAMRGVVPSSSVCARLRLGNDTSGGAPPTPAKRVRLFGVYIDEPPAPRSSGLPKKEFFP